MASVNSPTDAALATGARRVLHDPVVFARELLSVTCWGTDADIMRAVAKPHSRTSVKACHASAKTFTAANIATWFLSAWKDAIVVTTAPTFPQVKLLLWKEIHRAANALRQRLGSVPEPNDTEWRLSRENYCIGLSTDDSVRFQGFHAPHMLFIVDEAPGLRPAIWEAIEGAAAGGDVRVLGLGNPVIASGAFYDDFTVNRARRQTFTIDAFDTPNLQGISVEELTSIPEDAHDDPRLDVCVLPYLVTRRWVWGKWHEWGRTGHPNWIARVRGGFPSQSPDALLDLTWVEQARLTIAVDDGSAVEAGIDVAGPGEDETTVFLRQGPRVLAQAAFAQPDPRGEVLEFLRPYRDRMTCVKVDSAGIGYYLALHLQDAGFNVVFVNVGEASNEPEKYRNLKAQLYWGLRMRFEAGDVVGALDDVTVQQLTGIRYRLNARGQTEIESKDEARKRGVKSPDRAEGLMLAFADFGSGEPIAVGTVSQPVERLRWADL